MNFLRPHLRLLAWTALVAVLSLAWLPTLSRAFAPVTAQAGWTEVCTPQGMRLVAMGDDASDRLGKDGLPLPAASHHDHCTLCSQAPEGSAPLPATLAPAAQPLRSAARPSRHLQAVHTHIAWRSAPARAPPSHD